MADILVYTDSGRYSPVTQEVLKPTQTEIEEYLGSARDKDDVTSVELKVTATTLLVLKKSYNEDQLIDNLNTLSQCVRWENVDVLNYLADKQAHLHVKSVLQHLPASLAVQQAGLKVLSEMVCHVKKIRDELPESCGIDFLLTILDQCRADGRVQEYGMKIIQHISMSGVEEEAELRKVTEAVCTAINTFIDETTVLHAAIEALRNIVKDNGYIVKKFECQVFQQLPEKLHKEKDLGTTRLIALLFLDLCNVDNQVMAMIDTDVHVMLMELCARYPSNEPLMSVVMELLSRLNQEECVQDILLSNKFVQNGVFSILDLLKLSEKVQRAGLQIIRSLVPQLFGDPLVSNDVAQVVVKLLYTAMFTHIEHPSVQVESCRTLVAVLEELPDACKWIGENVEEKQDPVHNLCLGAMLMFRREEEVFVATCEAVYWLAADNARLCTSLMAKNTHLAVLEGLKRFRKSSPSVEAGCRALRGLCIFLDNHKQALVQDGAFTILVDLQSRYEDDVTVQIEILSTITCLADVDVVRHQCFVEKIPEKIADSMTRYPDVGIIQEAGLEAFAVLAGAEGGADLLLTTGALQLALDSMEQYYDNTLIQKKGLVVLQMFANCRTLDADHYQAKIVTLIHSALKNFVNVRSIQNEACVAIQLFAESSAEISKEFVSYGCHEFLFEILEESGHESGLQELASECLYVLSQEQNLKSAMLLSACKGGNLAATECLLELGSDVNMGASDSTTPLYLAVKGKHEEVVRLILRQEVQDLQTPLQQSLSQESHVITGLILQQLGFDREGECITWTGLNLETLDPSWIVTSLTAARRDVTDTDMGRYYLDKIKHSEVKRQIRKKLKYSKSDPTTTAYPNVRIHRRRHPSDDDWESTMEETLASRVPRTSAVVSNASPFESRRNYYDRSRSFDDSMQSTPGSSRRPMLPTILGVSPKTEDTPVFDLSPTDAEEWRQTTLTGVNVPFSSNDPRYQVPSNSRRQEISDSGVWVRKAERSTSPRDSVSSLEDVRYSPRLGVRKMSAPVLSGIDHIRLSRKMSVDSLSDMESKGKSSQPRPPLVSMDISENKLTTVEALASTRLTDYLSRLKHVDLRGNKLAALPDNIHENKLFIVQVLVSTRLTDYLSRLKHMDLHGNKLTSLSDNIHENLHSLEIIDLSYNAFEDFPENILHCAKIKELRVCNNKITKLSVVTVRKSLKKLYISHNHLQQLPEDLGHYLANLKELVVKKNDLRELPDKCLQLKELKLLDLSYNQIEAIPDALLKLCSKLETLDVSFNLLNHLPSEKLSPTLQKLNKIKVKHNRLAEKHPFYIPKFILELPSVRAVDLSENELSGLPPLNMWKSQTMKDFRASNNKIMAINLEHAKVWAKLEKLHVAHNNLTQIPREIGQLTCLCSLDFSHNAGITTLPDELGKCSKIYEMPTEGLELDLDRVLMKGRVKDIISFLHNRLKKARRYYRMKLMVVGYGGRGKTTLLRTLMKKNVKAKRDDNSKAATVGVVVQDWKFPRYHRRHSDDAEGRKFRHRKVDYTLNTWDFAGQEEFHSTHNCYLSNRAVYLVVFDLQKGVDDINNLKSWLASIRSRAPGCPVIVVGTHLDRLSKNELKRRDETNKIAEKIREFNIKPGFPNINRVFLVDGSCENENVDQLRTAIRTIADQFEIRGKKVMGEKIPASYVRLSELLSEKCEDMAFPVLRHRDMQHLVQSEALDLDDDELQQAVTFLHEAGVLLHYDDTSGQLRDFYFIDPGWLCRMMAQVITVRQINPFISKDGILRKRDINILFKGSTSFPDNFIPQYVKLLEKFEIALPHSDTELLIPCRLPVPHPTIHLPVQCRHELIKRIYRMPYIPMGLWFRLISRLVCLISHSIFKSLLKLSEYPRKVLWRKGVYVYWSESEYFLIDSASDNASQTECIIVTVPVSVQGYRILGQIIDHLDSLIDEWYPGLTSIDPLMGQEILEKLAPCPTCPENANAYQFPLAELLATVKTTDSILCPVHNGELPLTALAPDLVLGDVEPEFKLDPESFELDESQENRLGDGGYGMVYKAVYHNQDVAVKVFKEVADIPPLTMLRQEATILRCLSHPSVVSLVAVGIRPPVILLELAPCGTLGTLIKKGARELKMPLQHRIATQVAEGLVYLHRIMIVFRDMKPDNVLIFSTSMAATINAKISDYGIARFTSLQGLMAQEGTLAYRAPEVIRKETYSFKADIYSFGLTMYNMMTGRHPFDLLDSKGEMDRAIAEGMPVPRFERTSAVRWPDMQHTVMKCLEYSPDDRPEAREVYDILRRPEIGCLNRIVPVSISTTVECLTLQEIKVAGKKRMRLWVASGNSETFQLSYFTMNESSNELKGQLFNHGRIMCMQQIHDRYLALGTQIGNVFVFDTSTCTLTHASMQLQDSVLCMKIVKGEKEGGVLLVGLANGKIAIFTIQDLIHEENVDPVCLYPGFDFEPVLCMEKLGYRVFVSCGTQLIVLNLTKGIFVDKIVETDENRVPSASPINCMAAIKNDVYFAKKNTPVISIWDSAKEKFHKPLNIDEILGLPKTAARVTALSGDHKALWIGTHDGHLALVDPNTNVPLAVTHRYTRAVRCIIHNSEPFVTKSKSVFTGGLGLREVTDRESDRHALCGYVLVWDTDLPQYARTLTEYDKRRAELLQTDRGSEDSVCLGDSETMEDN